MGLLNEEKKGGINDEDQSGKCLRGGFQKDGGNLWEGGFHTFKFPTHLC